MARVRIDKDRCKGCYLCITACSHGQLKVSKAFNIKGIKPVQFAGGKCTGCTFCALICPECIIEVLR